MPAALVVTEEQLAVVEGCLRGRDLLPRVRERLEMVKALALGQDLAGVVRWSGRSERPVRRWVGRFLAGGPAAVADASRPGRPPRAGAADLATLEATVETPPSSIGLPFDVWTSARLAAYLAERTGTPIAASWLRTLLGRRAFACGRPKHTLGHLQDPDAVVIGEQALAAVEKKGGGGPRPPRAARRG